MLHEDFPKKLYVTDSPDNDGTPCYLANEDIGTADEGPVAIYALHSVVEKRNVTQIKPYDSDVWTEVKEPA